MSDEVEESDGVMYSVEAARSKEFRFEQEQVRLWMPAGLVLTVVVALFGFAAVRSQCLLMKRGMSEKARKRCVFIWALGSLLVEIGYEKANGSNLDSLIRDIARMLWAVMDSL